MRLITELSRSCVVGMFTCTLVNTQTHMYAHTLTRTHSHAHTHTHSACINLLVRLCNQAVASSESPLCPASNKGLKKSDHVCNVKHHKVKRKKNATVRKMSQPHALWICRERNLSWLGTTVSSSCALLEIKHMQQWQHHLQELSTGVWDGKMAGVDVCKYVCSTWRVIGQF